MHKILFIFIIVPSIILAFYNPFFIEDKKNRSIKVIKEELVNKKPIAKRQSVTIAYFGFVSSAIGEFALINFDGKNIVITQNDSLYKNDKIFRIKKITSNYIRITDKHGRAQTIYFSSDK